MQANKNNKQGNIIISKQQNFFTIISMPAVFKIKFFVFFF